MRYGVEVRILLLEPERAERCRQLAFHRLLRDTGVSEQDLRRAGIEVREVPVTTGDSAERYYQLRVDLPDTV